MPDTNPDQRSPDYICELVQRIPEGDPFWDTMQDILYEEDVPSRQSVPKDEHFRLTLRDIRLDRLVKRLRRRLFSWDKWAVKQQKDKGDG